MKTYLMILFICLCGLLSIHNTAFAVSSGGSQTIVCTPGEYSVLITTGDFILGNTCLPCGAGSFSAGATDPTDPNTNPTSCTVCSAGTFSLDKAGSCTACSAGTFSLGGAGSCTSCSAGTFSSDGAGSCTTCAAGSISASGAAACTNCSAGDSPSQDQSACNACAAGTYSPDGVTCVACPSGTISANPGASSCSDCPEGSSPNSDQTACTEDPVVNSQGQLDIVKGGGATCNLHHNHENLNLFSILLSFGIPFLLFMLFRGQKTVLGKRV